MFWYVDLVQTFASHIWKSNQHFLPKSTVEMYAKLSFLKLSPYKQSLLFSRCSAWKFILLFTILTADFCIAFRCMVHGYAFYIAVVAPVATILFVNTVTLIIVMYNLHQHGQKKARNLSDGDKIKSQWLTLEWLFFKQEVHLLLMLYLG